MTESWRDSDCAMRCVATSEFAVASMTDAASGFVLRACIQYAQGHVMWRGEHKRSFVPRYLVLGMRNVSAGVKRCLCLF